MLDLDHLTITKTKPKPKRKLARVNDCIEIAGADGVVVDAVTANATITASISKSHMHDDATHANRPTKKPSSSNTLPFTSSFSKQCTYKNLTCIQHSLWIYLILSFCLPKCKCNSKIFEQHPFHWPQFDSNMPSMCLPFRWLSLSIYFIYCHLQFVLPDTMKSACCTICWIHITHLNGRSLMNRIHCKLVSV